MSKRNYNDHPLELQIEPWFQCPRCRKTYTFLTASMRDSEEGIHYETCFSSLEQAPESMIEDRGVVLW